MENNKDYIFILEKTISKVDVMLNNLLMKTFDSGGYIDVSDIMSLIDEVNKMETLIHLIK